MGAVSGPELERDSLQGTSEESEWRFWAPEESIPGEHGHETRLTIYARRNLVESGNTSGHGRWEPAVLLTHTYAA